MKKVLLLGMITLFVLPGIFKQANAQKVIWTAVVQLDAVPANSIAKGMAIFRLTSDLKLHYRLMVQKLDEGDMITAAHIHYDATGGVAIPLAASADDFGKNMERQLTQQQYEILMVGGLYVNFHSVFYPPGNAQGDLN